MTGVLTAAQTEQIRNITRLASEIESVADYCERMANYRRRMHRMGIVMPPEAMSGLNEYLAQTVAFYDEILDRGQDTVARAPLRCRGERVGEAAAAGSGITWEDRRVGRDRRAPVLWNPFRRVEGVAAAVRPADVVEEQQRHRGAGRPGGDRRAAATAACRH